MKITNAEHQTYVQFDNTLHQSGNLQVEPLYLQAQTKTSLLKIITSAGSNCQTCVKDCKKHRPAAFERAAKILKFAFVKIPMHSSRFCDCKATNMILTHLYHVSG